MALNPAVLQAEILKLTDPNNAQFVGFPGDTASAAANWVSAFNVYFVQLSIPPVGPAAAAVAQPLATQAFISAVAAEQNPLDPIVTQYANAIVLAAATVGVATPPPGNPPIAAAVAPFIAAPTSDPNGPAVAMAAAVQVWAVTGMFTAFAPGSPPLPWS